MKPHATLLGALLGLVCLLCGGCGPGIVTDYPPVVKFTFPPNGYQTTLLSQNFTGTCVDGLRISLTYSKGLGGPASTTCPGGYFSFNAEVPAIGNDSFSIVAAQTDTAGNTGQAGVTFSFGRTALATAKGLDGAVNAAISDTNGNVYLVGNFTNFSGNAAPGLAKIDSGGAFDTSFASGGGFTGTVLAIAAAPEGTGDMYVGGTFTQFASLTSLSGLVRITNGGNAVTSFSAPAASGKIDPTQLTGITGIVPIPDSTNEIYVIGNFTTLGGKSLQGVARINSAGVVDNTVDTAPAFTGGLPLTAIHTLGGELLVGGTFTGFQGTPLNPLVLLNASGAIDSGFTAGPFVNANGPVVIRALLQAQDGSSDYYVGGDFTSYNGTPALGIVRIDPTGAISTGTGGTNFNSLIGTAFTYSAGANTNGGVRSIAFADSGHLNLVLGGVFNHFNSAPIPANTARIIVPSQAGNNAELDTTFPPTGSAGFGGPVSAIVPSVITNGSIYAAGAFGTYNGVGINDFALLTSTGSLDGSNITGTAFDGTVYVISPATDGSGDIFVGGSFTHFNGTSFPGLLRLHMNGSVNTGFNVGSGFAASVSTTGTAGGSTTLSSVGSTTGIQTGMIVSGPDILLGTTVVSTTSNTVTLSQAATGSISGTYTFSWQALAGGAVTVTGDTTSGTNSLGSLSATTGILPGMTVVGPFLPAGTTLVSLVGSTATLSNNASGTATGGDYEFYWPDSSGAFTTGSVASSSTTMTVTSVAGIRPGMAISGPNLLPGTTVVDAEGTTVTLSLAAGGNSTNASYQFFWTLPAVYAIAPASDGTSDIYVGGNFTSYQGSASAPIIRLSATGAPSTFVSSGTTFNSQVASAINGPVYAITPFPDGLGDTLVGGSFNTALGNGFTYGTGGNPPVGTIYAIAIDSLLDIFVGGSFNAFNNTSGDNNLVELTSSGSVSANNAHFGTGFDGPVLALSVAPAGGLYAGGNFTHFSGSAYTHFVLFNAAFAPDTSAASGTSGQVSALGLAIDGSGDFLAGGLFATFLSVTTNGIAESTATGSVNTSFSGTGFSGSAVSIQAIVPAIDGSSDVYVGGAFQNYQGKRTDGLVRLSAAGTPD